MKPLRLALVGFGWFAELLVTRVFGQLHEVIVVAVVDPSPERRARARELGIVAAESVKELPSDCDAVAVLTPHSSHRAIVEDAAALGLHVFCEKAFAVTSVDCLAMIEACRMAGVVLAVGHMQKLFPTHSRAIDLVRSGRYGEVVAVQVSGWHWCPVMPGWWRSIADCGGLLYWTGIHDLDTMRAVAQSEVTTAYAVTGRATDDYTEYEDSIAATLVFENGVIGTVQVAEHDPLRTFEESFQISILLRDGSIRIDPAEGTVTHAARHGLEPGEPVVERLGSFESLEEQAYLREFREFAADVREGRLSATAIDGLRTVETLEAIYDSVSCGEVVTVELHLVSTSPDNGDRHEQSDH